MSKSNSIAAKILVCAEIEIQYMRDSIAENVQTAQDDGSIEDIRHDTATLKRWVMTAQAVMHWKTTGNAIGSMMTSSDFQGWLEMANENSEGE